MNKRRSEWWSPWSCLATSLRCGGMVVSLACASTAFSAESSSNGYYVRAGLVQSELDDFTQKSEPRSTSGFEPLSSDGRATGWSVGVGYRSNPHMAVEIGYSSTSNMNLVGRALSTPFFSRPPSRAQLDVKRLSFALVGLYPIGPWEPFVKLGLSHSDLSAAIAVARLSPSVLTEEGSSVDPFFGVGVGYAFAQHYYVAIEASLMEKLGDYEEVGQGDLTSFSLSVHYRFR